MKLRLSVLLSSVLLTITFAEAKAEAEDCTRFQEETLSKQTTVKEFPNYNISMRVPINSYALKFNNGDIFITDKGTYNHLKCLQNNSKGLGRGIFGILITKGRRTYDINKELPNRNLRYIVATQNLQEIVLRLVFYDNTMTDITLVGGGPLINTQEVEEEIKNLLEIEKGVTAISNHI